MGRYLLQPAAELDLENIWLYTAREWHIDQADAYIDELDNCFQILAANPLLCPVRDEFNPVVRIHHHRSHFIVYRKRRENIVIIRVLHQAMDIEQHLPSNDVP